MEVLVVMDFPPRLCEPAIDDLGRVLTPTSQTLLEHLERGRQDEQGHRVGHRLAHLRRALDVDVEKMSLPLARTMSVSTLDVP